MWVLIFLTLVQYVDVKNIDNSKTEKDFAQDDGVVIERGHISLNDSEVVILFNSTFEIIEDFDRNGTSYMIEDLLAELNETESRENVAGSSKASAWSSTSSTSTMTSITSTMSTSRTTAKPKKNPNTATKKFHKHRPFGSTSTTKDCRKRTEAEKYQLLEAVGGRNQMYSAATPEEAGRGFSSLFDSPSHPSAVAMADAVPNTEKSTGCDQNCEMITSALHKAMKKPSANRRRSPLSDIFNDDTEDNSYFRTPCTAKFIPLGNCSELGEDASWTHEHLCSVCRGVYMLSNACFPKFFNAVKCNNKEMGCIFDTITDKAHGQCSSQTLSMKVLRNRGTSLCEDWVQEQLELPVACQCLLSKLSFLRSRPMEL